MAHTLISCIRSFIFLIISIPYSNAVHHYTINPLREICAHQNDYAQLIIDFVHLKNIKDQESQFVKQASALSAAAVIGTFSWPHTADAFWLAQMLWYCSFFASIFGLISSATQRLLEVLPDSENHMPTDTEMELYLNLVLDLPGSTKALPENPKGSDPEAAQLPQKREYSAKMMWTLQTPLMLMSWSWVLFLLGYALFLVTPFIHHDSWTTDHTARLAAIIFGVFTLCSYFVSAAFANVRTSNIQAELAQAKTWK